ncbi:MAG: ABC transporter permease [Bryobacterales bacterium]|nr:ABC transporter permease [Bryobacterales bacterium]
MFQPDSDTARRMPGHRTQTQGWPGEWSFLLRNFVAKDFKIRYRNMSLGVFWSLANPLVMMGVLTFVFRKILAGGPIEDFPLFVLTGLVPFNFFSVAWLNGSTSVFDNSGLIKKVGFPREIVPISSVLGNTVHFGVQTGLLIVFTLSFGKGIHLSWLWLPVVMAFEIVFVCGLALLSSAIDVYVRDVRYVVESANLVVFWLVPVFYSFTIIPAHYREVYQLNPIAAVVLAFRHILLEAKAPPEVLLVKLALVSTAMLGIGLFVFGRLKRRFADYL